MKKKEETKIDREILEMYRKILGNEYSDIKDKDIVQLANRIKGFCHSIINSHPKDFSGKNNNFLNFYQEKNE